MAEFKALPPPLFNPRINDYTSFSEWREEFDIYISATDFFSNTVNIPTQQAWLFNLAGAEFMRFTKQHLVVDVNSTVTAILDAIAKVLKPKHFDLQNRGKLFEFKQGIYVQAAKYLQDLCQLYEWTNYLAKVPQETLICDLFISGVASSESKRLLFQKDSDTHNRSLSASGY